MLPAHSFCFFLLFLSLTLLWTYSKKAIFTPQTPPLLFLCFFQGCEGRDFWRRCQAAMFQRQSRIMGKVQKPVRLNVTWFSRQVSGSHFPVFIRLEKVSLDFTLRRAVSQCYRSVLVSTRFFLFLFFSETTFHFTSALAQTPRQPANSV